MIVEYHLSLLSSPRIEPWVLSKLRSKASSMEQVESSWTGERPSPAPGENMATAFLLAKEASRRCSLVLVSSFMVSPLWLIHVPLLPHHVSLLFRFLLLRSLCGEQVSGLLQLQLKLPHFSLASFQLCSHLEKKACNVYQGSTYCVPDLP